MTPRTKLVPGTKRGPKILAPLGADNMGEVIRRAIPGWAAN